MYILISVTGSEFDIVTSFYDTKEQAHNAMIEDIIFSTSYKGLDEITKDANAGLCGFSDDGSWAETNWNGVKHWKIEELPEKTKKAFNEASPMSLTDDVNSKTSEAYFDVSLIEKPGNEGLTKSEMIDLMDMLSNPEAVPLDICDSNGNSAAMGFATVPAAEVLEWEYDQNSGFGSFIEDILDDMDNESEDGIYIFKDKYLSKDLRIWMDRR